MRCGDHRLRDDGIDTIMPGPMDFRQMAQLLGMVQPIAENPMARRNAVFPSFGSEGMGRPYGGGGAYRGVAGGVSRDAAKLSPESHGIGDMGRGTYVTPNRSIAESYGGGPKASIKDGTRAVHQYRIDHTPPENVAYLEGGRMSRGPLSNVTIRDGTGRELYHGAWKPVEVEKALGPKIKVVVGANDSIGNNQISVRDPSWLK